MATRKKASSSKTPQKTTKTSRPASGPGSTTARKSSAASASRKTKSKKRRTGETSGPAKARLTRRPPEAVDLEKANPASRGARKRPNTAPKPASIVSKRDGALDSYLITLEPTAKAVVAELRALVKENAPKAVETIRWRNLCWELDGVMCYASSAKKHVTFGFFRGDELSDPDHVLEGNKNKPERVVKLKDVGDIDANALGAWIREAAKLNNRKS